MSDVASRARDLRTAHALLSLAERHGQAWWQAWQGLQWSPTDPDGVAYHGYARTVLACASLDRGFDCRTWATAEHLASHGLRPRRGERATHAPDGTGDVVPLYNLSQATGKGDKKKGSIGQETRGMNRPTDGDAGRAADILWSGFGFPTQKDACMPPDSDHGPARLRATAERVALSLLGDDSTPTKGALTACLASLFAVSDAGIAPSECASPRAEEDGEGAIRLPEWTRLLRDDPRAARRCSELAEPIARRLADGIADAVGQARRARPATMGHGIHLPAEEAVPTDADARAETAGAGDACDVAPATPRDAAEPAAPSQDDGRYTLRSIVLETSSACSTLARSARGGRATA